MCVKHRIRRAGIVLLIIILIYILFFPIYVHRVSMTFGDDFCEIFADRDIKSFDKYFDSDSIIEIQGVKKTYKECRGNIISNINTLNTPIGSYGSSYGAYDCKFLESPFGEKVMCIHASGAGECNVYFTMKYGIIFKVKKIIIDSDSYDFCEQFFFSRKSLLRRNFSQ